MEKARPSDPKIMFLSRGEGRWYCKNCIGHVKGAREIGVCELKGLYKVVQDQ